MKMVNIAALVIRGKTASVMSAPVMLGALAIAITGDPLGFPISASKLPKYND